MDSMIGSQGEISFIFTSVTPVQCLGHKRYLNIAYVHVVENTVAALGK